MRWSIRVRRNGTARQGQERSERPDKVVSLAGIFGETARRVRSRELKLLKTNGALARLPQNPFPKTKSSPSSNMPVHLLICYRCHPARSIGGRASGAQSHLCPGPLSQLELAGDSRLNSGLGFPLIARSPSVRVHGRATIFLALDPPHNQLLTGDRFRRRRPRRGGGGSSLPSLSGSIWGAA
jgi:hypothetical protein